MVENHNIVLLRGSIALPTHSSGEPARRSDLPSIRLVAEGSGGVAGAAWAGRGRRRGSAEAAPGRSIPCTNTNHSCACRIPGQRMAGGIKKEALGRLLVERIKNRRVACPPPRRNGGDG